MGTWDHLYLHTFGTVYIEVDYEEGVEPSQDALNYLINKFNEISDRSLVLKEDLTDEIESVSIISEGSLIYSSSVDALRDSPNNPSYIYILYIMETYIIDEEFMILGMAPFASVIIIYEPATQSNIIEKNTLLHEMGHLFGLGHCDDPNCIMHYTISEYELQGFCDVCMNKL